MINVGKDSICYVFLLFNFVYKFLGTQNCFNSHVFVAFSFGAHHWPPKVTSH